MANLPAKGLQAKEIWQELEDAINERDLAVGGAGDFVISGINAGERLFKATDLIAIQNKVTALAALFINHIINGGDYHGELDYSIGIPGGWWPDILLPAYANVGDGTAFTRKFGEAGAIQTAYGNINTGDFVVIINEGGTNKIVEYLNELYRILDLCRWTFGSPSGFTDGEYGEGIGETFGSYDPTGAWAATVADFSVIPSSLGYLFRYSVLEYDTDPPPERNTGNALSGTGRLTLSGIATHVAHSLDWYIYVEQWPPDSWIDYTFDGDGIVIEGWNKIEITATNQNAQNQTAIIGDSSIQDNPGNPPHVPWPEQSATKKGWQMLSVEFGIAAYAIIKWDVAGGFSKVS